MQSVEKALLDFWARIVTTNHTIQISHDAELKSFPPAGIEPGPFVPESVTVPLRHSSRIKIIAT